MMRLSEATAAASGFGLLCIITILGLVNPAQGQICRGFLTFDKITGVLIRNAEKIPLFSSQGNTVTAECNNRCRTSTDCTAFLINYDKDSCYRLDLNADDIRADFVPADSKVNYFEKVCLTVPACGKAWIFERVPGYELAGYDERTERDVRTRLECQEICLQAKDLPCRSAEYDYQSKMCRMSSQTRRSQPAAYRASIDDVDYLENQCAEQLSSKVASTSCDYVEHLDQDIGYADLQIPVTTKDECQRRCDETTAFQCRSFTFFPSSSVCKLSGDDNLSVGPTALKPKIGANFYQRTPCVDSETLASTVHQHLVRLPRQTDVTNEPVSLICSATSMTVTLKTEDPFEGKMYAVKKPRGCSVRGTGRTEVSLTFLYQDPEKRCGVTVEKEGVFSNTVVVQHHPVIQQKGDRAVKLYCFFETGEKTVTNSYDVIAETVKPGVPGLPGEDGGEDRGDLTTLAPGISTSIVNGTAPPPSVVLRILNGQGEDVSGTKLGEPLYIRIELQGESIFDIFARNLIAKSGLDDEEIVLMDDRGCPADPVFPGLAKDNQTGALIGKFEAFKFSDTTVVNFQVNVQFCQDRCNPVQCGAEVISYGRKRRRKRQENPGTAEPNGGRAMFDPLLKQEIIVYDTPLRKQIFVDPGIKVSRFTDPGSNPASSPGPGIFVKGNFNEGDVVCTSWTMVIVAASCIVFLVFSILVVCVLCIYTHRKRSQHKHGTHHLDHQHPSRAGSAFGLPSSAASSTTTSSSSSSSSSAASFYTNHGNGLTSSRPRPEHSASTLKSLRTTLRD